MQSAFLKFCYSLNNGLKHCPF